MGVTLHEIATALAFGLKRQDQLPRRGAASGHDRCRVGSPSELRRDVGFWPKPDIASDRRDVRF